MRKFNVGAPACCVHGFSQQERAQQAGAPTVDLSGRFWAQRAGASAKSIPVVQPDYFFA